MAVDDDACDEEKLYTGEATELGTPTDTPPCDIVTEKKIPDELREPIPEGEQYEIVEPGPLVILSRPVHVECPPDDGSVGTPIDYPAGYYQELMYLSVALSLTQNVLSYIATNHLEGAISDILNSDNPEPKALRKLTGMKLAEADRLIAEAKVIQDRLTESVYTMALAQLKCCWLNNPILIECPDSEMLRPEDDPEAVFSIFVEGGQFMSCISQEDADRMAREALKGQLNCFYTNDPFTATCETRPDAPDLDMEPVPNDTEELYPGVGLRVGKVDVPAGMFKSYTSKDDANEQARNWGYSQLVCWYPNEAIHLQCEDPRARDIGIDPDVAPAHAADIVTGRVGQWVDIPVGYYISELSTAFSTEQARIYAESLLQCCYINRYLRMECVAEEIETKEHETLVIPPEPAPTSPVPVVEVKAGLFISCNSQEEADMFAQESVEGMLNCYYCNGLVLPTCVPDWVLRDVQLPPEHPDHIPLPLKDGYIFDTTHPNLPLSSLPLNATLGAAKCTVVAQNAVDAQLVAESLATMVVGGELCTYYNDKVIVACAAPDPYTGQTMKCGGEGYWGVDPEGEPYYFYSMYPPDACLYKDMTTPHPGEYIIVEAGMYMDSGEDKKPALNERAIAYAMSLLVCVFTNPPVIANCFRTKDIRRCAHFEDRRYCSYIACATCPNYDPLGWENFCKLDACRDADNICDASWDWGKQEVFPESDEEEGAFDAPQYLMDWSNGDGNTIQIPEGTILVQGMCEETAREVISEYIQELARMQLRCNYGNPYVCSGICVDTEGYSGSMGGGVNVCPRFHNNNPQPQQVCLPAKTLVDSSVAEARANALKLVNGARFCGTDYFITYDICLGEASSAASSSSSVPYSTPIPDHPPIPPPPPPPDLPSSGCEDLEFEPVIEYVSHGFEWTTETPTNPYTGEESHEAWVVQFGPVTEYTWLYPGKHLRNPLRLEPEYAELDPEELVLYTELKGVSDRAKNCGSFNGEKWDSNLEGKKCVFGYYTCEIKKYKVYDKAGKADIGRSGKSSYDEFGGVHDDENGKGTTHAYFSRGMEITFELIITIPNRLVENTDGPYCERRKPPLKLCGRYVYRTPPWPRSYSSYSAYGSSSHAQSSYSAYASSRPSGGYCFYECPNFKKAQAKTTALPVTEGLIIDKQAELQRWDTDVAYQYEHVKDELEELEVKLRKLTEQIE